MAHRAQAVKATHPPVVVLRIANAALKVLRRSPLSGRAGRGFMLLHFTGRKTGRGYTVPVSVHRHEGELLALTSARWRHNFHGGVDVDLTIEQTTTSMRGELVEDPAIVSRIYTERIASLGLKDAQRQIGLKITVPRRPTDDQLAEATGRDHLAVIRLTPRG
jgi:hypothetical protein